MVKNEIGLFGAGVMGQSLSLNIANNGYKIAVYDRTYSKLENFYKNKAKEHKNINIFDSIEEFIYSLSRPRKIILMISTGRPIDEVIVQLKKYLDKNDIIVDCGNSHYEDTERRIKELEDSGINYLGAGISGGEKGALEGPSIMVGGSDIAWNKVKNILLNISAKHDDNKPCCNYIGSGGSGHFVKMVHNGIEYGYMQIISEIYYLLRFLMNIELNEISQIFNDWNENEETESYLVEITSNIMKKIDDKTGKPLIDMILDVAGNKGTGKWTSMEALDLGIPLPTITEAVFSRYISTFKTNRKMASNIFNAYIKENPTCEFDINIEDLRKTLFLSQIICFSQGFSLIKEISENNSWNINLNELSSIWKEGCIIRSGILNKISNAFDNNPQLSILLFDKYFVGKILKYEKSFRKVVSKSILYGMPIPAISSSLNYFDQIRNNNLPTNLIQAQRDYFGAHTYERIDKVGQLHTNWY